jgi:hypothetical protein
VDRDKIDARMSGLRVARRDWAAVRAAKERYWRALEPAERLRLADELRRQALAIHPDWPTAEQRSADERAHVRLLERFERAASACKR